MGVKPALPAGRYSLFFFILTALFSFLMSAGEAPDRSWVLDSFDIATLSAGSTLFSLTTDRDGCLWLAAGSELIRFDGRRVRRFDSFFLDCEPGVSTRLVTDARGRVWMRDEAGTVLFHDGGHWHKWSGLLELGSTVIMMSPSEAGELLLVGENRLAIVAGSSIVFEDIPFELNGRRLTAVYRLKNGALWYVEADRVSLKKKNGSPHVCFTSPWVIEASIVGPTGELFVVGGEEIVRIDADGDNLVERFSGDWREPVTCMRADPAAGCIWLGTRGDGLWCFDIQERVTVSCPLNLEPLFISDMVFGAGKDLWLATQGSGLLRLSRDGSPSILLAETMADALLTMDREGGIWAAQEAVLWHKGRDDSVFVEIAKVEVGTPRFWITDSAGQDVLLGDYGLLNAVRHGEGRRKQSWPEELLELGVLLAGYIADDGALWLSCSSGLARLNGRGQMVEKQWEMEPCRSSDIVVLKGQQVWLIRDDGLFLSDGAKTPVLVNNPLFQKGLKSLVSGPDQLFALHKTAGVGVLDAMQWQPVNLEVGPASSWFQAGVRMSSTGQLWISDALGFTGLESGLISQIDKDGLPCPTFRVPAALTRSQWGVGGPNGSRLWWLDGLRLNWYELDTGDVSRPVRVSLDRLTINGRERDLNEAVDLVLKTDDMLQLQLLIPRLVVPGETRIMYRIEGGRSGWQPLSSQGDQLLVTGLEPGAYRLETCVNAADGRWQEKLVQLRFSVRGPVSGRLLPMVGVLLLMAVLAALIWYRRRTNASNSPTAVKQMGATGGKYSTSGLSPERAEEIRVLLLTKMSTERPYLQASLTMRRLADQMGVHYNHLSQVINDKLGRTAKDFINGYRVEAAAKHLADSRERRSIMDIAYECGFYSKSVFNAAFKKEFSVTPSEYREQKKKGISS